MNGCSRQNPAYRPAPYFAPLAGAFCLIWPILARFALAEEAIPPAIALDTREIFKRLKIGLSLVVGFVIGKLAAAWSPPHYSELFSAGFLAGAIGTQAAFRLFELWRRKRPPR